MCGYLALKRHPVLHMPLDRQLLQKGGGNLVCGMRATVGGKPWKLRSTLKVPVDSFTNTHFKNNYGCDCIGTTQWNGDLTHTAWKPPSYHHCLLTESSWQIGRLLLACIHHQLNESKRWKVSSVGILSDKSSDTRAVEMCEHSAYA